MAKPTRWVTETADEHSQWYVEHFRALADSGQDLAGEARLVDAMVAPSSRILDAGCGTGRTGAELARRGHEVVGVDADPELLAAAIEDHPGPTWVMCDLSELRLSNVGGTPFNGVVAAGNVIPYLAEGTVVAVLTNLRESLVPGGFIVTGFGTDRGYDLDQFDLDANRAGLFVESRFATWDLRPWTPDSDFAVSVLRVA